jgi:hypothetical protein
MGDGQLGRRGHSNVVDTMPIRAYVALIRGFTPDLVREAAVQRATSESEQPR